ncbi:MAG: sigma-70 family RNA polymerase sigma factor [Bacteroidota bacterium]
MSLGSMPPAVSREESPNVRLVHTKYPTRTNNLKQSKTPDPLNYAATHQDIIDDCRRGSRQAQFELYRLYSKAMYNICLRMLKDEMDAEDMLQNSFVDVFTKLHTFQHQSAIGAWIKRIVINNCINFLKKRRLHIEELNDNHSSVIDTNDSNIPEAQLSVEQINKAVHLLPEGYRVVFTLYLFEGYDHKEIGEILKVSEATSKSQYSRAKKKLKTILAAGC